MASTDPVKRIEALLDGAEPLFRREFLAMVNAIKNEHTLEELADLLSQGRIDEALRSINRGAVPLAAAWTEVYVLSGKDTAGQVTLASGEILVEFDQVNFRAVQAMRENQLRLVQEFAEQQRRATQRALIDGIQRGLNPREQARAFRNSIGLTEKQQAAVNNYRRLLENLDRQALTRKLRDVRSDGTVRRAIDQDKPLTQKQIDTMVGRYRQRSLKLRSETIARTEALRSVHEGSAEMFRQAIQGGILSAEQLTRIWNTSRDERVRGSHRPMHEQERGIDEPFVSGAGNLLMHPGDVSAPAEEVIKCRCVVATRIASIGELQGLLAVSIA